MTCGCCSQGVFDLTEEKQAPGQPTSVHTQTFSDSILVTWSPPEDATVVRGYMIGYGEGVPDVMWRYVNAEQRNFTIKNLSKASSSLFLLQQTGFDVVQFHKSRLVARQGYCSDL